VEDLAQGRLVGFERDSQLLDDHRQLAGVHRVDQAVEVGEQRLNREWRASAPDRNHVAVTKVWPGVGVRAQVEVLLADGGPLGDDGMEVGGYADIALEPKISPRHSGMEGDRLDLADRGTAVRDRRVGV